MKKNCCLVLLALWCGPLLKADGSQIPAVLFAGSDGGGCGHEVANRLVQAGFALRAEHASLSEHPLAWDELTHFNVVVLSGLGLANADMSLGRTRQTIAVLNRYLEAGGGVVMLGAFGQMATAKPPQDAFLKPFGLTPLFDEMPDDSKTAVAATSWRIPFAFTDAVTESPVCAGVKGFWYPVPRDRVGGQNHTISFVADALWQVVLRGSDSSLTRKGALQESRPEHPGAYSQKVPLAAIRSVGKGRLMFFGITPEYLFGAFANSTLEGIVLDKGLNGRPSDGFRLVTNSLRWLAEPTLASGTCGGAKTEESLLRNPHKVRYAQPYSWPEKSLFPSRNRPGPGWLARAPGIPAGTSARTNGSKRPRPRGSPGWSSSRNSPGFPRKTLRSSRPIARACPPPSLPPSPASPSMTKSATTISISGPAFPIPRPNS